MNRIMLDLETLGTKPGSVILAIGAVRFDAEKILDEFYVNINPESSVAAGLTMDVSTITWWLQQSDEARKALVAGEARLLPYALQDFARWAMCPPGVEPKSVADLVQIDELWGNGSDFDNVLLARAYEAVEAPAPWKHRANRCYRTLKSLYPEIPFEKPAVAHNALEDARAQAKHLIEILKVARSPMNLWILSGD